MNTNKLITFFTLLTLSGLPFGCSVAPQNPNESKILKKTLGEPIFCTLIFDQSTNDLKTFGNSSYCKERTAALASFQIPLAAMSFDAGVLPNEQVKLSWDGQKRSTPAWNRDHSAASWMKYSVTWYGQRLAKLLGPEKMKSYVEKMHFGNEDLSGGLVTAWLGSSPESKTVNTLKISPKEMMNFWNDFWNEKFEINKRSYQLTKRILQRTPTPDFKQSKLWGQSTSGVISYDKNLQPEKIEGHFLGHMETNHKKINFVTFIQGTANQNSWKALQEDSESKNEDSLAAVAAEKVTWEILKKQNI